QRVDERLGHRHERLPHRVGGLGGGGRDAAGAETGLVGEDAAGDTVLDRGGDPGSDEPAGGGGAAEGVGEDELDGAGQRVEVEGHHGDAADDVKDDHHRDEGAGDAADGLDAAEDDHAGQHGDDHAGEDRVDPPLVLDV